MRPPPLDPPPNELKSGVLEEVTNDEKSAAGEVLERVAVIALVEADDLNDGTAVTEALVNKLEGLGLLLLSFSLQFFAILLLLVTKP